ncbi:TetR/AcrR family transcriptional regulator [Herbaspirillum sp. WKF16]|jgi:AcrR family transcriptional regulator|uniref:TetR/AcrR family transcriptional regulator n=1 Tax=Herbaspirillum sp. WKF16 TaxID=3028312 RepID=UPI0023A94210|nr:TetR/AcrR family transcriptional regulator [Herbaspirillum sp. WKF16]WDZ96462.1 TetR/AcrR family transcriptional regulator [Herbaspirillum sp. WKF16]
MAPAANGKTAAERAALVPVLAEVFRAHGYDGASLARITEGTGLGKGSLYHYFPGGKEEMAQAVLAHIDHWFELNVFAPLRDEADPAAGVARMFDECANYFLSGRKVCIVGVFALSSTRDRFALAVKNYFTAWAGSLHGALLRAGHAELPAAELAEDTVGAIQGALVLARAVDDPEVFMRTLARLRARALRA